MRKHEHRFITSITPNDDAKPRVYMDSLFGFNSRSVFGLLSLAPVGFDVERTCLVSVNANVIRLQNKKEPHNEVH